MNVCYYLVHSLFYLQKQKYYNFLILTAILNGRETTDSQAFVEPWCPFLSSQQPLSPVRRKLNLILIEKRTSYFSPIHACDFQVVPSLQSVLLELYIRFVWMPYVPLIYLRWFGLPNYYTRWNNANREAAHYVILLFSFSLPSLRYTHFRQHLFSINLSTMLFRYN